MIIYKKSKSLILKLQISSLFVVESPGYFLLGLYLTSTHKVIHFKLNSKESHMQTF